MYTLWIFVQSRMHWVVVFFCSGNFFNVYPRHNQLISINKRHTGKSNVEFNLRHDWNSLLSNEDLPRPSTHQPRRGSVMTPASQSNVTEQPTLTRFGVYSRQMFPHRTSLLRYLHDFAVNASLRIRYDTAVGNISRVSASVTDKPISMNQYRYTMTDQRGEVYQCQSVEDNYFKLFGSLHFLFLVADLVEKSGSG